MNKEITINYSYYKRKYLIHFFENNILKEWKEIDEKEDFNEIINKFYHS